MSRINYEYAPMTGMQAIAKLSIALYEAKRLAEDCKGVEVTAKLLECARLCDYLQEKKMHDRFVGIHTAMNSLTWERTRSAITMAQNDWEEVLRENDTRYTPTHPMERKVRG